MSLFMKGDSNESYLWCVFLLLESFCHRYAKLNFQMHHICFSPYWKRLWDFLWLFHYQNVITIIRIKLKWILHGFGQKNAVFLFWFGNSYLGPNCLGSLQKMTFYIQKFFSKRVQIRMKHCICSNLLRKS